eukprot:XP_001694617.1 predicted protein [Chlamydomonas reinhardtii]
MAAVAAAAAAAAAAASAPGAMPPSVAPSAAAPPFPAAPAAGSAGTSAPSGGTAGSGRKVSTSDIQLVQNLIERCMQMYMPLKEVVSTLQTQAKIEPGFTQLVWQKLEEQNAEFFKAYHVRLKIKDQIVMFNYLLEQQVHRMSDKGK